MKSYLYKICVAVLLLALAGPGVAQKVYKGQITVVPYELRQRGDSLFLNMDFDFSGLMMDNDRFLTLTPVLVAPDRKMELPEIRVNGRRQDKVYRREVRLRSKKYQDPKPPYAVIKSGKKTNETLRYKITFPYEAWMKDARLDMMEDLCNCGAHAQQIAIEKLVNKVSLESNIPYEVTPFMAYVRPVVEDVKRRSEQREAFLDFPVNQTVIRPTFGNNPQELNKIEQMIREIKEDGNVRVTHVGIMGYASPEGSIAQNNRLSQGRAEALRNYLSSKADFPAATYQVEHGGEDWNGLEQLLSNSSVSFRGTALSIIRNTYNVEERKRKLQELEAGQPYQYMLKNLYPQLRRVISRVDYNVRGFAMEEAKQVIKTRPQQLSLEEMFLVANSYEKGSASFAEVFETAVRMFPDDKVANLNAAASALMLRDLGRAEKYLERADSTRPEYLNNLGVFFLMRGDFDHARDLLNEASQKGIEEARHNLVELEKKVADEKNIRKKN